jgi:hypothetical protein
MHETARHAIHSFEILNVSVETMEALQQLVNDVSTSRRRGGAEASRQIRTQIDFQIRTLRSLSLRSQSNKERLQNEISLVRKYTLNISRPSANTMAGV